MPDIRACRKADQCSSSRRYAVMKRVCTNANKYLSTWQSKILRATWQYIEEKDQRGTTCRCDPTLFPLPQLHPE